MQRNHWKWRSLLLFIGVIWLFVVIGVLLSEVWAQTTTMFHTPTPNFDMSLVQSTQAQSPAISSELIGQIFLWGAPLVTALVALYVTLRKASSTRADASAAVATSSAQTEVDQRNVLTKLAAGAVQANEDVRAARKAAEEAVAVAVSVKAEMTELGLSTDKLRTENITLNSTVTSQQSEINTLKQQVLDLNAASLVSKDELKERDAEIKRLNAELYRVATNNMPPGFVPQQQATPTEPASAPLGTEANPMKLEINNTKDNPVPTVSIPDKPAE